MYNPITFIKDIIDLLRNPPGEATHACEITELSEPLVHEVLDERGRTYIKYGDFLVAFENDLLTIVPRDDFHKHFAFSGRVAEGMMTPVTTIKPL